MASGYIPDGYTETTVIPARKGVHEAVRITYRPATVVERTRCFGNYDKISPDERLSRCTKLLVEHVTEWSLEHEGRTLPISEATLERLRFELFDALTDIVSGTAEADEADEKN